MLDVALKMLKELTSHSYEAYIVGGFVRDHILGIESKDIDITTNATPKDIRDIFKNKCLPNEEYGSVVVMFNGVRFEVTTFREDMEYFDNRHPSSVNYVDDLYTDLLRRDFTINSICIDENGTIIDYLGGQEDINNRIIRTIGNPNEKFRDDTLRILRAIRFATLLDFKLSDDVIRAIRRNRHSVKKISFYRRKQELDKLFSSPNRDAGIELILHFHMEKDLGIKNLKNVYHSPVNSSIGVWSMLEVDPGYVFNKNELDLISKVRKAVEFDNFDPLILYKYGLYINSCAASIKGLDIKDLTKKYNELIIKSRDDIDIDSDTIMRILNKEPGKYLKNIYDDLENNILYNKLENKREILEEYIVNNYSN